MSEKVVLKEKMTVLVNSCDSYDDLWDPFFTLFDKYWEAKEVPIILNTETKKFSRAGLQIISVNSGSDTPYGKRFLQALSQVKTEYVFLLLDDFFIRNHVDMKRIHDVIKWMDKDRDIVYFNSDCTNVYADWEVDLYPGFRRIPPGSKYTLNMQAAVWRTSYLKKLWRPNVSPWEWEEICNYITSINTKYKFYCTTDWKYSLCDYGFNHSGMGVYHGKWVVEDVHPLFEKENIQVDFSRRGVYDPEKNKRDMTIENWWSTMYRCFGIVGVVTFFCVAIYRHVMKLFGKIVYPDFLTYIENSAKRKFLRENLD